MTIYQPRNILITGGAGFIGANFIRYLLTDNPAYKIINLDLLTYAGDLQNLNDLPNQQNYQFIHGDICNRELIKKLFQQNNIDTIVHFAAESHVDRSITGPAQFVQTNVVGTCCLLDEAKAYWQKAYELSANACRFHHISTDEVYGMLGSHDPAFTETTAYAPNSPYSASKAASDHFVRSYHHTYGLPITLSNCSNNYGPYQHSEKLIPTIINNCLCQQAIPIYGDGSNIRDWLYVVDHCQAIHKIIHQGRVGETYNIGGNHELSNLEVTNIICQLMDELIPQATPHQRLIKFVKDRPGHDWRYAIDNQKLKSELNWQPHESFATGIKKTIEFYCQTAELAFA